MDNLTPKRITVRENGEANSFAVLDDDRGRWWLSLLHNGEALTELQRHNMRRLAACWNACEGLDTETLEALAGGTLAAELGRLELAARSVSVNEAPADVGALVVVNLDGGTVADVRANVPARVVILDDDTEGGDASQVAEIEGARRYVSTWCVGAEDAAANAAGLADVARIADSL